MGESHAMPITLTVFAASPDEGRGLARDMGVQIKAIANSHAHLDHIMGIHDVHSATGAMFLLHRQDLDLLQNGWKSSALAMGLDLAVSRHPDAAARSREVDDLGVVDNLTGRIPHGGDQGRFLADPERQAVRAHFDGHSGSRLDRILPGGPNPHRETHRNAKNPQARGP